MPKVSVVIPTYNRSDTLQQALKCIDKQTYTDLEIMVVQNGGRRDAAEVCRAYQKEGRFPLHYHEIPQANPSDARNWGVQHASGEFIAFHDDDDLWEPEKTEKQMIYLEQHSDVGLVSCTAWLMDENEKVFGGRGGYREECNSEALVSEDLTNLIPSLTSVIVRKECFEKAGGFKAEYLSANDFDLYLKLAKFTRLRVLPERLFYFRRHSASMSGNIAFGHGETVLILKRLLKANPDERLKPLIQTFLEKNCRYIYSEAYDTWKSGDSSLAVKKLANALRHDPLLGRYLPWGRFSNVVYKVLQPYFLLGYVFISSLFQPRVKTKKTGPVRIGFHVYGLGGLGRYVLDLMKGFEEAVYQPVIYYLSLPGKDQDQFIGFTKEKNYTVRLIDRDGCPGKVSTHDELLTAGGHKPSWIPPFKPNKEETPGLKSKLLKLIPEDFRLRFFYQRLISKIAKKFREDCLDVMHISLGNFPMLSAVVLAALEAGIPKVIVTVHLLDVQPAPLRPVDEWLIERIVKSKVKIIAISQVMKKGLMERHGFDASQIEVIYNGVDAGDYSLPPSKELSLELGIQPEDIVALIPARLAEVKGHDVLLDAIEADKERFRKLKILLAGDGHLMKPLKARVEKMGLQNRVSFLGYRTDIAELVSVCDFILLPSLNEAVPFSILEGMAARKPVVATDVGAIKEMIVDQVTGFIVPAKDTVKLAAAISRILEMTPEERLRLGTAGYERVQSHFTLDQMRNKTCAFYGKRAAL